MKQVYTTKDAYQNSSVRVNYFQKDFIKIIIEKNFNEETQQIETKTVEEIYDLLLFCERLFWETNEIELNDKIEQTRQQLEERINN